MFFAYLVLPLCAQYDAVSEAKQGALLAQVVQVLEGHEHARRAHHGEPLDKADVLLGDDQPPGHGNRALPPAEEAWCACTRATKKGW